MALRADAIDPASFTALRLVSGALTLWLLLRLRRSGYTDAGSWHGAIALFAYAIAFSYAYVELTAGLGALLLFGAVQVTMLGAAWQRGEALGARQWFGASVALLGLAWLRPSNDENLGSWLAMGAMLLAGMAWGAYSLLGRSARAPLAETAGNFLRASPLAVLLLPFVPHALSISPMGALYAVLSGSVASGLGYAIWYAALPSLRSSRAALLQLLVPALAAVAGVLLLGEAIDARLLMGGIAILGGVALGVLARPPPARTP